MFFAEKSGLKPKNPQENKFFEKLICFPDLMFFEKPVLKLNIANKNISREFYLFARVYVLAKNRF